MSVKFIFSLEMKQRQQKYFKKIWSIKLLKNILKHKSTVKKCILYLNEMIAVMKIVS